MPDVNRKNFINTIGVRSFPFFRLQQQRRSVKLFGQYRTNELVRWRMHFLSDAIAEIEGLLEVNRDFCKKQMAEKASPALPTNCAVVP